MKELILNPISISLIFLVLLVYLFFFVEILSHKSFASRLDKPIVMLIFIGMFPIAYPPFFLAHVQRLCTGNLSFVGTLTTLFLWVPIVFLIKRVSFPNFPKDLLLVLKDRLLTLLIGMSVASSLWSETPVITFRSSLALVIMATLIAHIIKKYSWQEIEAFVRGSLTIIAPISLLFTLLLPSTHPFGDPWGGLMLAARSFGALMSLNSALWFAIAIYKGKFFGVEMLASISSFILIVMGAGKTQLISTLALIYLIIVLKLISKLTFRQSVIAVIIATIVTGSIFLIINVGLDAILQMLGKDRSLTGRGDFWPQLIQKIIGHPIGFGYNGFWQPWRGNEDPAALIGSGVIVGDYRPPHSHNGFLEVALQLGYVGIFVFLFSFFKTLISAIWHQQFFKGPEAIFPLIVIVFLIMTNLSETEKLGLIGPNYATFYYLLIAMKLSTMGQYLRNKEQKYAITST